MPNVNLMGANPAQPFDLQTQQAQLAQMAQIAQALIADGLKDQPATVHTGGGNPFARDVVNLAPLGNIAESYFGNKRLSEIQGKQGEVAGKFNEQYQTDVGRVMEALLPHMAENPMGPPDAAGSTGDMAVPGDIGGALRAGFSSTHPAVQAISASLMKGLVDAQAKMLLTPEAVAGQSRNLTPQSITQSTTRGLLGLPVQTNTGALEMKPVVGQEAPASRTVVTNINGGGMQQNTGEPNIVPPRPIVPPDTPGNPTGLPVTADAAGDVKVVPGAAEAPQVKAQTEIAKGWIEKLQQGQHAVQSFAKTAPALTQMINLAQNAQTGITANWVTDARRVAKSLGVNEDDAGKIVDTQTLIKYAMPQATEAGKEFNSRVTQMEFTNFMKTFGADPTTDLRTMVNIFKKSLVNGLNEAEVHNHNVETAGGLPQFGAKQAESYLVNLPKPEDLLNAIKGSVDFSRSPLGVWQDAGLGSPESHAAPKGNGPLRYDAQGHRIP